MALAGCFGGAPGENPAAPPSPPAEIPSFLTFPESVAIDVDTVRISAPAAALSAQVGPGGEFSEEINIGPESIAQSDLILDAILRILNQATIPVSEATTTLTATVNTFNPPQPAQVTLKFDFSDFDLDGDGEDEGCSGSTCPVAGVMGSCPSETAEENLVPVCFRVWLDGQQFVAGFFDEVPDALPTPANKGAGRFRAVHLEEIASDQPGSLIAPIYDHRDPDSILTELFFGQVPESGSAPSLPDIIGTNHSVVSQETIAGEVEKSIQVSAEQFFGTDFISFEYVSRFIEGFDFVGLHALFDEVYESFFGLTDVDPAVCAVISTGEESATGLTECQALGIDVTGIPFLDFATADDFDLPADFPASPGF
jgi:hypothetical protein